MVNPFLILGHDEFKALGCPDDRFAAVFTGRVQIYQAGSYDFFTLSDDGSHLFVDGSMVVDNGGLHGSEEKQGAVQLSAGFHNLKVDFFENAGGAELRVFYRGLDTRGEKLEIDALLPPASLEGEFRCSMY